ncbi:MAG: M56 family metallopeptidase [Clostridium sp.]|uniref:M56 family metallopeptidase n=1 Tax=Clostridium sp. TaxID=1506 RepID=UPI0039E7E047
MYESLINNLLLSSLISSIIILFIIILRKTLLKKYSKTLIYYLWVFPILKMIIIFRFSIFISNKTYKTLFKESNIINSNFDVIYSNNKNIHLWKIIFCIWLIGLIAFLIYHICAYLNFTNKIKFLAYDINDDNINKLYSKILYELNIKKKISLKYCKGIGSPLGIGIFKSLILLPVDTYNVDELELILKHELIHFKRHDLYYKILVMIIMSIHWFNPLVYIMWKQINHDCELSCDEIVLKDSNMELRKLYAMTFIKSLKSNRSNNHRIEIITGFNNNKEILKRRLENIVNLQIEKKGLILAILVGIISITSFFNIKIFAQNNEMNTKPVVSSTKTKSEESSNVNGIDNTKQVDDQDKSASGPRVIYKGPIKDVPKEFAQIKSIQEQIKENPNKYIILQSK